MTTSNISNTSYTGQNITEGPSCSESSQINFAECTQIIERVSDSNELKGVCHLLLEKFVELNSKVEDLTLKVQELSENTQPKIYPLDGKQKLRAAWQDFLINYEQNYPNREYRLSLNGLLSSFSSEDLKAFIDILLKKELIERHVHKSWDTNLTAEGKSYWILYDMVQTINETIDKRDMHIVIDVLDKLVKRVD